MSPEAGELVEPNATGCVCWNVLQNGFDRLKVEPNHSKAGFCPNTAELRTQFTVSKERREGGDKIEKEIGKRECSQQNFVFEFFIRK